MGLAVSKIKKRKGFVDKKHGVTPSFFQADNLCTSSLVGVPVVLGFSLRLAKPLGGAVLAAVTWNGPEFCLAVSKGAPVPVTTAHSKVPAHSCLEERGCLELIHRVGEATFGAPDTGSFLVRDAELGFLEGPCMCHDLARVRVRACSAFLTVRLGSACLESPVWVFLR